MKPFVGLPITIDGIAAIVTKVNENGSFYATTFPPAGGTSVVEVSADSQEWKNIGELFLEHEELEELEETETVTTPVAETTTETPAPVEQTVNATTPVEEPKEAVETATV